MAVIGKGQVVIEGKDKTAKAFKSAQGRVTKLSGSVKALGATMIAAFGVRQVTRFAGEILKTQDALAKMSKATGLSSQTIENFRNALELSGLTATQADSGLRTFVKRVGELKTEQGAAFTVLKKFDAGLLHAMQTASSTDEALRLAAQAIQQIEDPMQKAAVSSALFSKKVGVDLTAALQSGEQGLYDLMAASEAAVGKGLGPEQLAQIERFNDEMETVKDIVMNQVTHAFSEMMPLLLRFSGWLQGDGKTALMDFIGGIKELWASSEGLRHVLGTVIVGGIDILVGSFATITEVVGGVIGAFQDWANGTKTAGEAVQAVITTVKVSVSNFVNHVIQVLGRINTALGDPFGVLITGFNRAKDAVLNGIKGFIGDIKRKATEIKEAFLSPIESMVDGVSSLFTDASDSAIDSAKEMAEGVTAWGKKMKYWAIGDPWAKDFHDGVVIELEDTAYESIEAAQNMSEGVTKHGQKMVQEAGKWSREFKNAVHGIFDDLAGGIGDATGNLFKDILNGNKDALKNFGQSIKDTIVNAIGDAIGNAVKDKLSGVFKNVLGNIFGGGGGSILGGGSGGGLGSTIMSGLGKLFGGGTAVASSLGGATAAFPVAAGGGGGMLGGVGGFLSKITGAIGKGFTSLTGTVGGGLSGLAAAAAPLAIAGFGFMKSSKVKKAMKKQFSALMADPAITGNMANEALGSGFKVLGQVGEDTFVQIGGAADKMFRNFSETSGGIMKDRGGPLGFLSLGFKEMRDEFGNVIVTAKDFEGFMNTLNVSAPFIEGAQKILDTTPAWEIAKENIDLVDSKLLALTSSAEKTNEMFAALADGVVTPIEAMKFGIERDAPDAMEQLQNLAAEVVGVQDEFVGLGEAGKFALSTLDMESERVTAAMADGFITATEMASLGFEKLGAMTADTFRKIQEGAGHTQGKTEALAAAAEIGGSKFANLGAEGYRAMMKIDLGGKLARDIIGKGVVSALDAARFGMQDFGVTSAQTFEAAVRAAQEASGSMRQLGRDAHNAAHAAAMANSAANNRGQQMKGFATGGSFMVGGHGGVDTNVVAFKATKGEKVTIETPQQQRTSSGVDESHALLSEIANSIKSADDNNVRALNRQRWAEAANSRH